MTEPSRVDSGTTHTGIPHLCSTIGKIVHSSTIESHDTSSDPSDERDIFESAQSEFVSPGCLQRNSSLRCTHWDSSPPYPLPSDQPVDKDGSNHNNFANYQAQAAKNPGHLPPHGILGGYRAPKYGSTHYTVGNDQVVDRNRSPYLTPGEHQPIHSFDYIQGQGLQLQLLTSILPYIKQPGWLAPDLDLITCLRPVTHKHAVSTDEIPILYLDLDRLATLSTQRKRKVMDLLSYAHREVRIGPMKKSWRIRGVKTTRLTVATVLALTAAMRKHNDLFMELMGLSRPDVIMELTHYMHPSLVRLSDISRLVYFATQCIAHSHMKRSREPEEVARKVATAISVIIEKTSMKKGAEGDIDFRGVIARVLEKGE